MPSPTCTATITENPKLQPLTTKFSICFTKIEQFNEIWLLKGKLPRIYD